MAKTNISFNNKNYQIDEASLSTATAALRTHLSTTMNGTGATINLGGTAYNIDSTKLSAATNEFITHLGKIAGTGHKVMVNGTEYSIDSTKLTGAVADIEAVLAGTGEERLEGDGAEYYTLAPTALSFRSTAPLNELQEVQINGVTVDPSNYALEEGSTIVTFPIEYLKTLNVGNYEVTVASESKSVKGGFTVAAPELNEYGFYYNQPYVGYVQGYGEVALFYREDSVLDFFIIDTMYVENATYTVSGNTITNNASLGAIPAVILDGGDKIQCAALGTTFVLGNEYIVADEDYIYTTDLINYVNCYGVFSAINKNKSAYGSIKTNINEMPTLSIISDAFRNCINLTSIDIPNSIITIKDHAFDGCLSLINVGFEYNSKLERIERQAFLGCKSLTSLDIPDSVTFIDVGVFKNCSNLKNVKLSNSITIIYSSLFEGCTNLTGIVIPSCVSTIESSAFKDCTNMTNITLPSSISLVHARAFYNCENLTNITFEGTIEQWNAIEFMKGTFGGETVGDWFKNVPATYVQCTDGQVAL